MLCEILITVQVLLRIYSGLLPAYLTERKNTSKTVTYEDQGRVTRRPQVAGATIASRHHGSDDSGRIIVDGKARTEVEPIECEMV